MSTYPAQANRSFPKPVPSDVFAFTLVLIGRAITAGFSRVFRGPLRKSWSWQLEVVIRVSRSSYELLARKGPLRYKTAFEKMLPKANGGGATIKISEAEDAPGHWFIPGNDNGSVILYFHGGGYVYGSVKSHGKMIGEFACAASARTLALNYRLAPEHPHPAAVDDACAAYRYLVKGGTSPKRIVFAGDSAGGGLVLLALLALRDAGDPLPAAGVCLSPWVDLACSDESFASNSRYDSVTREACLVAAAAFLNGSNPQAPEVSPLFANLKGLPALLIHAGQVEVLRDQICNFAERAKSTGLDVTFQVYDDMPHVWHMLSDFTTEADKAINEIAGFIRLKTDMAGPR